MVEDLIKKLLESGVHFGHQTSRWNPKMKKYIFGQRSGIYIIDLEKTVDLLNAAREYVRDVALKGGRILFVGTKKQAQVIIEEEATKADMFYIRNRWLGGLLTNFETVKKSIRRLTEIEQMSENGIWENLKKKETARLNKEKDKLLRDFGGIREMKNLPEAIFIVDPKREEIAVKESKKLGIPIIGLVDTNCDPDCIDFPIPGNDDALKSIRFIASLLGESIKGGREEFITADAAKKEEEAKAQKKKEEEKAKEEAEAKKDETKATAAEQAS